MTIDKKIEDMTPLEMLAEIHKRETDGLNVRFSGENSCPEPECGGYLVLKEGCKYCWKCGYSANCS